MARRVDDLGRIVLPVEMRRLLGVRSGDAMDISVADGTMVLRKQQSRCVFCDESGDGLGTYRGRAVCAACAADCASGGGGAGGGSRSANS
ncbi:MAG: AbrB/MazE/SpoVT family DNA-binding domain-containing protein [Acidimicrobiales bacterium]